MNNAAEFSPLAALWARLRAATNITEESWSRLLTPYYHLSGKSPRVSQEIAIDLAVQGVLQGKNCPVVDFCRRQGKNRDTVSDFLKADQLPVGWHQRHKERL